MYLDFYRLREKPFNLTPDPRFVFLSRCHREAFAHLLYGINHRTGFMVLTGEVGSGKTTVLRTLLNYLPADRYRTALIFNPSLSSSELLHSINRELGIPTPTSENFRPLDTLNHFLLQEGSEGRTVVLAIDEAQDLEPSVLEQIRLISNLETDRKKLIQIILAGQPELIRLLNKDQMRQLNQRITVRYHLEAMDYQDTVSYVAHRLKVAGGTDKVSFSEGALKRIYNYSRGLPRLINAACDRCLLAGYTKDTKKIDRRIAGAAIKDLKRYTIPPVRKRYLLWVPVSITIVGLVAVSFHFGWVRDIVKRSNRLAPVQTADLPAKNDFVAPGEELSRAMARELGGVSELESARYAFNALAACWNVPPILERGELNELANMEHGGLGQDVRLHRFFGNLGTLVRIGFPAVLELTIPGVSGKRFLLFVGAENEKVLVTPAIGGRRSLSFGELDQYWSGRGYVLWKDPLKFPPRVSPGARGDRIKRLQELLREVGTYRGSLTGIYDRDTVSAVKEFQSSKGIEQDGIVGAQTLILLYRSTGQLKLPEFRGGA